MLLIGYAFAIRSERRLCDEVHLNPAYRWFFCRLGIDITPKKYQSSETEVTGGISKVGDGMVRAALYEAATTMLRPLTRFSALKHWAMQVAE